MSRSKTASGEASSRPPSDPGERALWFFNNLTHTGDYAGEPFRLRPWQADPIRRLFGTIRPGTDVRQYRKTFWALPRKQGKTEVVAGGALYLAVGQMRREQRVYTASGDVKQAKLIFDAAVSMVQNDPELNAAAEIYTGYKRIEFPGLKSYIEVLSSVPKSKHGLGPTGVLIDEYHVVDEKLVKVLTSGFGARKDPLTWMITTAGDNRYSLCYDEWEYAVKVRDNPDLDPTYLPVIFAADRDDDWKSEAVWHKAMPALGDFCSLEFIREEFKTASERPRFENDFKQLYLNLWTEQRERWLSVDRWDDCGTLKADDADLLTGRDCYAGFDGGVTGDMSALVLAFPNDLGGFDLRCRFWVPREGRWRNEKHNEPLYRMWERAGYLTFTEGEANDFDQIERDIAEENDRFPFRLLCADRAFVMGSLNRLFNNYGIPVKGITQGPITLNEPMVRLEEMILNKTVRHDAHPVLKWNVANANVKKGPTGLMFLDKSGSGNRIDGLAATVDALAAAIGSDELLNPYTAERGLIVI